jgi:hypothetical protein
MACDTPNDIFRQATESLGDEIYLQAVERSIALNLIPREEYKSGTGLVQSVFTMGRSMPESDEPETEQIEFSDGETFEGTCGIDYKDVPVGFNEDTFGPEKFGWKGPVVCAEDLIYSFKIQSFLPLYVHAMAQHSETEISNRLFAIYDHFVPKRIAKDAFPYTAGSTGTPPQKPLETVSLPAATCMLTQEMLDKDAAQLNSEGAFQPNSNGWLELGADGPIYPLLISQEASQALLLENEDLRMDTRYAAPSELLKRMGATRVIKNFRHVITLYPPRYTWSGNKYTRVPTWRSVAGTKGEVSELNPAWIAADYEGARVLNPFVFHDQIVRPVSQVGNMKWGPINHMGDWKFVVGGNRIGTTHCLDPMDKLGRHFAEYHHAPKPIFPAYGRLYIYKRCLGTNVTCTSCS